MLPPAVRRILSSARTVAVLGAHDQTSRPAFYVPDYLHSQGYTIIPVNSTLAGKTLWGRTVLASLGEIDEPVDVVDVFRRSDALPGHLDEIIGMPEAPRVVWFQQGIRNDEVARALEARGIEVIQDRCMLADHRVL